MQDLEKLNKTFYKLYGDLSENEEFLTKKQSDTMSNFLLKQYITEYLKIALDKEISDRKLIYELKTEARYYIPKRIIFFYNKLGKIIAKEIKKQAFEYFNNLKNNNGQPKT